VKRLLTVALLFIASLAGAQTTSSNFLPASTGLDLGAPNQKWDLFSQSIDVYTAFRLNDTLGNHWMQPIPSFATSLVTCTKDDGTRCYFDTGSATTNGLRDCGVWNPQTTYPLQCVVQYAGSSWVAAAPTTGIAPGTDNGVDWHLFAVAGSSGVNGTNGSNGAPGTPGYSPNQLLSGGGVVWISNYNYTVSAASYIIQNTGYSSPQTNISLSASDPTFDRCDLVYVNNSGVVGVATGVASAQPACPVLDPATQLAITALRVDAGSTQPGTIVQTDIYHENTEWTMSRTGTPINLASTNNPHAGTVDIEATNAVTGNFFTATDPLAATVDLATRNNFIFYIRPKAAWTTNRSITIQWYNGATPKCTAVSFTQGTFAFNSAQLAYQQIVIPTSLFACNGLPVTAVRFTVAGTSTVAFGWYIDDIILQGGVPPSQGSNAMVWQDPWNATKAYGVNDTVSYLNNGYVAMVANVNQAPYQLSTIWHPITNIGPPWISNNPNPASAGIMRLANTDKICSRNAGNSGDLCFWLDSSNVWNLDGIGGSELGMSAETTGAATQPAAGYTTFINSATAVLCTKDSSGTVVCPQSSAGTGTVTSIATTSPITGGTITNTGTIACATCVVASSPGAGVAHFAGSTQTVTSSTIATADIAANAVTSAKMAVVNTRLTCMMQVGDGTNTVVSADYSPFKVNACKIPMAAHIVEIDVQTDSGTPSVVLERRRGAATLADLLSGALAAAGTTWTCAMSSTGATCIDGTTSSGSITTSNTALNAGDVIEVKSGTGSTETSMRISVVMTID
jgi:hypothetical protein